MSSSSCRVGRTAAKYGPRFPCRLCAALIVALLAAPLPWAAAECDPETCEGVCCGGDCLEDEGWDCCNGVAYDTDESCCTDGQLIPKCGEDCCDSGEECCHGECYDPDEKCCTPDGPVTKCGNPSDNWGVSVTVDRSEPIGVCKNGSLTLHFSASTTGTPPASTACYTVSGPTWSWSPSQNITVDTSAAGTHSYTATATATYTFTAKGDCPCPSSPQSKSGSKTVNATVMEIVTQTAATVPQDRTRKKVGVGEPVTITCQPASVSPTWSPGTYLNATSGNPVTFTAPDIATTATVTATYAGASCSVTFTVVEPASETAVKDGADDTWPAGTQGAGMHLEITIHPDDVSFEYVESREVAGPASNITGYFTTHTPPAHNPTGWIRIASGNHKWDHAAFWSWPPDLGNPPTQWSTGGYDWDIPIQWRVVGKTKIGTLPNRLQTHRITAANGTSTVSKLGCSATRTP